MHDFIIYALCDARTHQVRYIGKSERGLVRPLEHQNYSHNPDLAAWLRDLVVSRSEYVVLVLATATSVEQLADLEAHWIATGRYWGWPLCNRTHRPRTPDAEALIPPGKRWNLQAWRRDPDVRARLAAARGGRKK